MQCVMVNVGQFTAYLPLVGDNDFFSTFLERMKQNFVRANQPIDPDQGLPVTFDEYPWPKQPMHLWDFP